MQAIKTVYKGPTNSKGSRIIASCDARRITVPYDHALDVTKNHEKAARKLAEIMKWQGRWASGSLKTSFVHVWVGE